MQQTKAYEKVIEHIKKQIINHDLTIGEKLPPEREISEQLGVSRNSVREAIHMLEMMGFISSQQGAGNYVSCNFEKNLVESMSMMFILHKLDYGSITQLRFALEMQAFVLAVDNISKEEIQKIGEYILNLDRGKTEEECVIWDKKIHYAIAKASHNVLIIDVLQALSDVLDTYITDMRREIFKDDNKEKLQQAHKEIAKCMIEKDLEGGRKAIEDHFDIINSTLERMKTR